MFGPVLDHWILRPFTHSRNRRTECELDAQCQREEESPPLEAGRARVLKMLDRFEGRFPLLSGARDYFASSVYAILRKRQDPSA